MGLISLTCFHAIENTYPTSVHLFDIKYTDEASISASWAYNIQIRLFHSLMDRFMYPITEHGKYKSDHKSDC